MDDSNSYNLELISIADEAKDYISTLENSVEGDTESSTEFEELD